MSNSSSSRPVSEGSAAPLIPAQTETGSSLQPPALTEARARASGNRLMVPGKPSGRQVLTQDELQIRREELENAGASPEEIKETIKTHVIDTARHNMAPYHFTHFEPARKAIPIGHRLKHMGRFHKVLEKQSPITTSEEIDLSWATEPPGNSGHIIEAFHLTLLDETIPVNLTLDELDELAPACDCGDNCRMVKRRDDTMKFAGGIQIGNGDDNPGMWVCARGECLFLEQISVRPEDSDISVNSLSVGEIEGMSSEDSIFKFGGVIMPQTSEDDLREQDAKDNVDAFWKSVATVLDPVPEHVWKNLLHGAMERCWCRQDCRIVCCKISGDYFVACNYQTCNFLAFYMQKPASLGGLSFFDRGENVAFGSSSLDRYTNLGYIGNFFGHCFDLKFLRELQKRTTMPKGSYLVTDRIKSGNELDFFMSYRGASGRVTLYMAICGKFNINVAFVFITCVCPWVVLGMSMVSDPCHRGVPRFLTVGGCYNATISGADPNTGAPIPDGEDYWTGKEWFVFRPYMSFCVGIIILFWHTRWTARSLFYRIWLDKFCINQFDPEEQWNALRRLPLYLQNSKQILCLFDDKWAGRLWCVWELALYLRLRTKPVVQFCSIHQKQVEVVFILLSLIVGAADNLRFMVLESVDGSGNQYSKADQDKRYSAAIALGKEFILSVAFFILGMRHFRSKTILRQSMENYDIRNATCAKASDAEVLLQSVEDVFSSNVPDDLSTANCVPTRSQVLLRSRSRSGRARSSNATQESRYRSNNSSNSSFDISPDDLPESEVSHISIAERPGLDDFNDQIRSRVPRQLPVAGLKSFIVLSYQATILAWGWQVATVFDRFAYGNKGGISSQNNAAGEFFKVVYYCWQFFVKVGDN